MNELSMTDQETILGLLRLGWSARRVARQTGHRRETVARYGIAAGVIAPKPAMAAEVATDSPPRSEPEIQPKPAKVATDSAVPSDPEVVEDSARSQRDAPATTSRSRSSCEAHRAFIDAEVPRAAMPLRFTRPHRASWLCRRIQRRQTICWKVAHAQPEDQLSF